jgi:hypothetical protein
VPERSRRRHAEIAVVAVRVALVVALVPLLAAGCGNEAGDEGASQSPTATEAVDETTTEIGGEEDDASRASPPPASPGPVVRFAGSGDRVLPPVEARSGGAALRWRNRAEVFSLFYQDGVLIDSVERSGDTVIPAGRYQLSVVASGGWTIELQNARRAR